MSGLSCSAVLADLSRLLDGELPEAEASRLKTHVSGCDVCERFGRRFAGVIQGLREGLGTPDPLDPAVVDRLRARMASR
ncbi:MAG TPA: zf-HC2 domain-containing protein [Thermoanaerobaculia bacterium]|nr:zf-HC2 domain-containing protein [Thermoanaerobaculia bacterium]